jgi:hypothetical protein
VYQLGQYWSLSHVVKNFMEMMMNFAKIETMQDNVSHASITFGLRQLCRVCYDGKKSDGALTVVFSLEAF